MGILLDGAGLGIKVLERLHVSPESLRTECERVLSEIPGSMMSSELPFSPGSMVVLEATLEEQRRHRHNWVGTEHLVLGLLDVRSTVSGILRAAGADLDEARRMTVLFIGEDLRPRSPEEILRAIAASKWRM